MRLSIHSLSKSFGQKTILDQIELTIEDAGIWALIGPNGSGKTTLMDCIANLQTADSGEIHILGQQHTAPTIYQSFSYLQDNRLLYPELTGLEHLKLIQKIQGLERSRTEEVIEEIGIAQYVHQPVKSYSLGMKQHLLLAIGIMNKPKLMLLDEPLNGLDPTSYIKTRQLLLKMAEQGSTIIVSSHQLTEVDQLTNRLLFLKNGRLIQRNVEEIKETYIIQTSNDQLLMKELKDSYDLQYDGNQLYLKQAHLHTVLERILSYPVTIRHIEAVDRQAEDLYKEIFEEDGQ